MEMCYDGALVMPSSFIIMDQDEMTYLEAGNGVTKLKSRWYGYDLYLSSKMINRLCGAATTAGAAALLTAAIPELSSKLLTAICTVVGVGAGAIGGIALTYGGGDAVIWHCETLTIPPLSWLSLQ